MWDKFQINLIDYDADKLSTFVMKAEQVKKYFLKEYALFLENKLDQNNAYAMSD